MGLGEKKLEGTVEESASGTAMPGRLLEDEPVASSNMIRLGKRAAEDAPPAEPTLNGVTISSAQSPTKKLKFTAPQQSQDETPSARGEGQQQQNPLTISSADQPPPPELEHITFGYQPLSTLIARVSQECFNDLNELVSDLPQHSTSHIPNGVLPPSEAALTSLASAKTRQRWLEFASSQRERFLKLSVLLSWSRRVDEVGKLIDIIGWIRDQELQYENAGFYLGQLKRDMLAAKMPNPDIETAHEVLSNGTSARFPDVGSYALRDKSRLTTVV